MKTDPEQLRTLKARLLDLSASSDVTLPASFVMNLVDDVEDCHAASDALDKLGKRLDALEGAPPPKPRLVLVQGGEEDVLETLMEIGGEGGGGDAA